MSLNDTRDTTTTMLRGKSIPLHLHKKKTEILSPSDEKPTSENSCPGGIVALTYASHGGRDDRYAYR